MSKAKEKALEAYPEHSVLIRPARRGGYYADNHLREGFINGYEQAEKDTIERAITWLKEHAKKYIVDCTPTYPDAEPDIYIGGKCWEHLRKAMEEE